MAWVILIVLVVIFLTVIAPLMRQRSVVAARTRKLRGLQRERGTVVITIIHRQEQIGLFGVPLVRFIDIDDSEAVLRAPGMLALHIAFDRVEQPVRVRVWKDEVAAYDMGDIAAQWFSDFLSEPGRPRQLRMVRFDPEQQRLSNHRWTGDVDAPNQFADGYPVLVASEGSMAELNARLAAAGHGAVGIERFRPNVVLAGIEAHDEDRVETLHIGTAEGEATLRPVKPCTRCPMPDIDPATALSTPEVGDMLRTYRADPRVDGAISFGMNAIVLQGVEHALRVGQRVGANLRFE